MTLEIVLTGTWLYDGTAETPVDIVALDYDWWYALAEADGQLHEGEKPMPLGPDGRLYYVRFQRALEPSEPTWVDSFGHLDLTSAVSAAEEKIRDPIHWHR